MMNDERGLKYHQHNTYDKLYLDSFVDTAINYMGIVLMFIYRLI